MQHYTITIDLDHRDEQGLPRITASSNDTTELYSQDQPFIIHIDFIKEGITYTTNQTLTIYPLKKEQP